jgi:small-conductance mechanosensitive channel
VEFFILFKIFLLCCLRNLRLSFKYLIYRKHSSSILRHSTIQKLFLLPQQKKPQKENQISEINSHLQKLNPEQNHLSKILHFEMFTAQECRENFKNSLAAIHKDKLMREHEHAQGDVCTYNCG